MGTRIADSRTTSSRLVEAAEPSEESEAHSIVSWAEGRRRGWFKCSCGKWFETEGYASEDKSMGAIIVAHQALVTAS